ncbi:MAG: hypothetical protein ABII79_07440 [bacterium]
MKKVTLLAVLVLAVGLIAYAGEEAQWFDMENCAFCSNMCKNPELIDHMIWEHHNIANGMLSITTVEPEFKAPYTEAMDAMKKLGEAMEVGKVDMAELKLCGACQHYGTLEAAGAKSEYIFGEAADIFLMTSDDPELVKKIQEYGQRNNDEMAKMEAAKKKAE